MLIGALLITTKSLQFLKTFIKRYILKKNSINHSKYDINIPAPSATTPHATTPKPSTPHAQTPNAQVNTKKVIFFNQKRWLMIKKRNANSEPEDQSLTKKQKLD